MEARTELEHMLYACKDEAEARGSARLEALAQSVEEWLDGVEAGAVEGRRTRRRRAGGVKGCNGSTATAVRPWGLLPPEVAGRQAAASFGIVE